jgi:hypothetical protein
MLHDFSESAVRFHPLKEFADLHTTFLWLFFSDFESFGRQVKITVGFIASGRK